MRLKKTISIAIVILLFAVGCSSANNNQELEKRVAEVNAVTANVLITKEIKEVNDNNISTTYSVGFSGVIYKKENNKYYVLTAYHSIENNLDTKLYVLLWNQPRYNDLERNQKRGISLYYESMPVAKIEYYDIKYDLAILSFDSEEEVYIFEISQTEVKYDEQIGTISNTANKNRNYLSFGKITSKEDVPFGDDKDDIQHKVIEHNAYIYEGSSGSVVFNENLQIVGINLGASTNIFKKFKRAKAIPSNRILEFLDEYMKSIGKQHVD